MDNETAKELGSLIQRENDIKVRIPKLPQRSPALSKIIESTFNVDILELYEEIDGKLDEDEALNPEAIRLSLAKVEKYGMIAHQLYSVVKLEQERIKTELQPIEAKMRAAAVDALTSEKNGGKRRKQVTEADVSAKMFEMFSEYSTLMDLKNEGDQLVEHLKANHSKWENKSRSLSSLNKK